MARHQDLTAEYLHIPGFFQATDPGAIGAGKLWIDTSGGTGLWEMKLRNATDDGWEPISGGSGFTDHGVLLGLGDDDHPQYHNDARGDVRYAPLAHTHGEGDITDLGDYLTEAEANLLYALIAHTHVEGDITDLQNYSLVGHTHTEGDITDLGPYADASHTHVVADITDFDPADYLLVTTAAATYEVIGHTHVVADITDFDPTGYLPLTGGNLTGSLTSDALIETDVGFYLRDGLTQVAVAVIGASLDLGDVNYALDLLGSAARPQYNGADIALLSDTGGGGVTDHGALTGLLDDDHTQYFNQTRGDARYAQLGHSHVIGDITDFDPTDYLPLAGGEMSGPIDFNLGNGLRFWDTVSEFVNLVSFDSVAPAVKLGGESTNIGAVPVRAVSPELQIGSAGLGQSTLTLWEETSADFLTCMTLIDAGALEVGESGRLLNLRGNVTRPQYNGNNLALYSDLTGVVADHGSLTGLGDDDHPQYYNTARGDARWALIGHTHNIGDITDFDASDYLPLAGGIMTGAIDFSDGSEGPRWFDTVDTYVNMISFDDAEGILRINGISPNLGPIPTRIDSFALEFGVDGAGGSTFAMYSDGAMSMVPAILLDVNGFSFGESSQEMNLNGSLTRPKYNSNDLALFSDIPTVDPYSANAVPTYGDGSTRLSYVTPNAIGLECGNGGVQTGKLTCRECIIAINEHHTGTITFDMNIDPGGPNEVPFGTIGPNTDPSAVKYDFDIDTWGEGAFVVVVRVNDGTESRDTILQVVLSGTPSGP